MSDISDANTKLIINEIRNVSKRISYLPTEDRVRTIYREEQQNCPAFQGWGEVSKKSSEHEGILKVINRHSIAPAARVVKGLHPIVKILIPVAVAVVGALLGVDLSGWL